MSAADVIKTVETGQFPPAPTRNLRRNALRARVAADALLNLPAAKQTAAAIEAEASAGHDVLARDAMHLRMGPWPWHQATSPAQARTSLNARMPTSGVVGTV
jgi:hypothetical protein